MTDHVTCIPQTNSRSLPVSQEPSPTALGPLWPHILGTAPSPTLSQPSAVCTAPSVAQLYSISEFGSLPFLVSGRLSPQLIAGFCSKSTSQEGAPCLIYYNYWCPNPTTPHLPLLCHFSPSEYTCPVDPLSQHALISKWEPLLTFWLTSLHLNQELLTCTILYLCIVSDLLSSCSLRIATSFQVSISSSFDLTLFLTQDPSLLSSEYLCLVSSWLPDSCLRTSTSFQVNTSAQFLSYVLFLGEDFPSSPSEYPCPVSQLCSTLPSRPSHLLHVSYHCLASNLCALLLTKDNNCFPSEYICALCVKSSGP